MVSPRIFMSKTSSEHWKELSSLSPRNSQLFFIKKHNIFKKKIFRQNTVLLGQFPLEPPPYPGVSPRQRVHQILHQLGGAPQIPQTPVKNVICKKQLFWGEMKLRTLGRDWP